MNWYDVPESLRRRVKAGDAAAMRVFFEDHVCRPNRITFAYTADRTRWFARIQSRFVSVPPPVDWESFAVALHEAGHVLAPDCTGTGEHRPNPDSTSHACLACERNATAAAHRMFPFNRQMHDRLRQAISSYRVTTPAPLAVQRDVDQFVGSVAYAERRMGWLRMDERIARLERAKRELEEAQRRYGWRS